MFAHANVLAPTRAGYKGPEKRLHHTSCFDRITMTYGIDTAVFKYDFSH